MATPWRWRSSRRVFGGVEPNLDEDWGLLAGGQYSNDRWKVGMPVGTAQIRLTTRRIALGVTLRKSALAPVYNAGLTMADSTRAWGTLCTLVFLSLTATSAAGVPEDERYFTAYGGASTTGDSALHLRRPGANTNVRLNGVAWNDKSFESPLYYGFRYVQFQSRRPWLGIGVDFFHYKVYADPTDPVEPSGTVNGQPVSGTQPLGNFIQRFSISHGVNYVTFVVIARTTAHIGKPFNEGRFRAYAGLGAGPAILHPEAAIGDDFKEKYQFAGWGWQAFGGVEYLLDSGKSVFAEGKFSNDSFKVDVPGGTARTRLSTRHVAVGVSFKM